MAGPRPLCSTEAKVSSPLAERRSGLVTASHISAAANILGSLAIRSTGLSGRGRRALPGDLEQGTEEAAGEEEGLPDQAHGDDRAPLGAEGGEQDGHAAFAHADAGEADRGDGDDLGGGPGEEPGGRRNP